MRFSKIYKINLFDINKFTNQDRTRVMEKQKQYLNDNECIDEDKEFLIYSISNQESRKSNSNNKINIYTTILLALIPMIIIFYKPEQFIQGNLFIKALTIILFYIMGNISFFILQVNKVSGVNRERYADLKESTNKKKDIILSYYLDYQSISREADRLVSFVKNIEIYISGAIISIILLTAYNYTNSNYKSYKYSKSSTDIYQLDISKLEKQDKVSVEVINEVNKLIPDTNIKKVLILYNSDQVLSNESFNSIISYFNIYRNNDDIILLREDASEENNKLKIILVEE